VVHVDSRDFRFQLLSRSLADLHIKSLHGLSQFEIPSCVAFVRGQHKVFHKGQVRWLASFTTEFSLDQHLLRRLIWTSGQAEVFDQSPTFNSTAPNPNNTQLLRSLYHYKRLCELCLMILTSLLLVYYAKSCVCYSRRYRFTAGIT
jgi:hypothetical protein